MQREEPSQSAAEGRATPIKYDSAVHAKRVESALGGLESGSKVFYFRAPRYAVVVLVLALLMPWAVVAVMWLRSKPSVAPAEPVQTVAPPVGTGKHRCKPGPWGRIEYYDMVAQPPDEFISPSFFTEAPDQWLFKGYSKAALVELLVSAGLTPEQRSAIEGCTDFSAAANQCVVKPPFELVSGLSPASRAKLYAALGKFAENPGQRDPFIFMPEQIDEWLDDGGLAESTEELVRKLLYPHGNTVLLSDTGMIMKRLTDADERVRLLRILFRRNSVYPRLILTPDADVKALTAYWGKGGHEVEIGPLLNSLPRNPEGVAVNVALLLPKFARERLYRYPLPSSDPKRNSHDCHWSAFNFFNDPPEERFGRPEAVRATLENDCYPVPGSPTLGDLVLFTAPDVGIIHSAVYVADDILFTKGGPAFTSPWLLMTKAAVLAAFPAYERLNVSYHRLKKL